MKSQQEQAIATAQCVLNVINDRIFVFADNCRNDGVAAALFVRELGRATSAVLSNGFCELEFGSRPEPINTIPSLPPNY